MSVAPVGVYALGISTVPVAGQAVDAAFGPLVGGFIKNPLFAADQGLTLPEVLFVDPVNSANLDGTGTTVAIQPGGTYIIRAQTTSISVNAASAGHRFSGVVFQAPTPFPPAPQPGPFPPAGPTTLTEVIAAYLYQQYADDDDLQAFIAAWNSIAQGYVSWFSDVGLPVYTGLSGPLLDWVAEGLYGMKRPALSSGRNRDLGPLNTYPPNTLAPNQRKRIGPSNVVETSDDVFKRIMTWNFYKGDGNVFNVRWLKRRIMRFLIGADGSAPNVDQTYAISVTFGSGIIAIRIATGTRDVVGGAIPNRFGCNQFPPNRLVTTPGPTPGHFALEPTFKEAMDAGVLQMPFQYDVVVSA